MVDSGVVPNVSGRFQGDASIDFLRGPQWPEQCFRQVWGYKMNFVETMYTPSSCGQGYLLTHQSIAVLLNPEDVLKAVRSSFPSSAWAESVMPPCWSCYGRSCTFGPRYFLSGAPKVTNRTVIIIWTGHSCFQIHSVNPLPFAPIVSRSHILHGSFWGKMGGSHQFECRRIVVHVDGSTSPGMGLR